MLCYLFAWNILGWFITDPHTLDIAHALLMITLWSYAVFGNTAVLSGIMRGSGTVLWPTVIGIFAIWGVEVPAAYLLMHRVGSTALDGLSDRVLHRPRAAVLLLRVRLETQDPRTSGLAGARHPRSDGASYSSA